MPEYLTEEKLGEELKVIFPNNEFRKQIYLKDICNNYNGKKLRVDYFCFKLKLVVEFDGYGHYTNPNQIVNDMDKNIYLEENGYKLVRIPYFVQLCPRTIKYYFDVELKNYLQLYPHGFIDKKAVLPAKFCSMGISRFNQELEKLPDDVSSEIFDSLLDQLDKYEMYEVFSNDWWDTVLEIFEDEED